MGNLFGSVFISKKFTSSVTFYGTPVRAVYRNFARGGANLGYGQKRGGGAQ